jgi:hypothetical protein
MTSKLDQASDVALGECDAVAPPAGRRPAGGKFGIKPSEFDDFSFDVIASAFAEALAMIGATSPAIFGADTEEIAESELDAVTGGGGDATADMLSKLWQSKVDNMSAAILHK